MIVNQSYRWISKIFTFLVLIALLYTNGANLYVLTFNDSFTRYELSEPIDNESEGESESSEKDIHDKIRNNDHYIYPIASSFFLKHAESKKFQSAFSIETPTPPPRSFYF